MYYPSSENKGADQLRGYREADLRLCFRLGKNPVFSRCGSDETQRNVQKQNDQKQRNQMKQNEVQDDIDDTQVTENETKVVNNKGKKNRGTNHETQKQVGQRNTNDSTDVHKSIQNKNTNSDCGQTNTNKNAETVKGNKGTNKKTEPTKKSVVQSDSLKTETKVNKHGVIAKQNGKPKPNDDETHKSNSPNKQGNNSKDNKAKQIGQSNKTISSNQNVQNQNKSNKQQPTDNKRKGNKIPSCKACRTNSCTKYNPDEIKAIISSQRSNGALYYKIKWNNGKSDWYFPCKIPDNLIREYHVHRTLSGKKRKRPLKQGHKFFSENDQAVNVVESSTHADQTQIKENENESACLVFNPIMVDNYAAFFNCTPVGRTSDSMMAPT